MPISDQSDLHRPLHSLLPTHNDVLARGLEVGRVVAIVVFCLAHAHIVASQRGQLLAPLHHNHARSSGQSHVPAIGQALAKVVVSLDNMLKVLSEIHYLALLKTAGLVDVLQCARIFL